MPKPRRVETGEFVLKASEREAFVSLVWEMGEAHLRDGLPWRFVDDPYAVYVSEVMLQQTQVSRVMKYWPAWMKTFPSIDALASASTADVLERWQGLGYNRRALAMKRCAQECSASGGALPRTAEELQRLPGIGPATAAGIVAFAYNQPSVYIETNVRTVFIHHFFPDAESVDDRQLQPLVSQTCSHDQPRKWYYALLDYGAHLKSQGANSARKSTAYTRQGTFEGSARQKRAFIVREVLAKPGVATREVLELLNDFERSAGRPEVNDAAFDALVAQLAGEGFFACVDGALVP